MTTKRALKTNLERLHKIARILVEASVSGDERASQLYGVSLRSIGRYRVFMASGTRPALELTEIVRQKIELLDQDFSKSVKRAMNSLADYMRRCGDDMSTSDPRGLRAAAGAVKLGGERYERFVMLERAARGEPPVTLVGKAKSGQ